MMSEYIYDRLYSNEYGWLINNPTKIDGSGNQIYLVSIISDVFPGKPFKMFCKGDKAKFVFDEVLSENDQFLLSQLVTQYQTI